VVPVARHRSGIDVELDVASREVSTGLLGHTSASGLELRTIGGTGSDDPERHVPW
jgi:hypothetical protein